MSGFSPFSIANQLAQAIQNLQGAQNQNSQGYGQSQFDRESDEYRRGFLSGMLHRIKERIGGRHCHEHGRDHDARGMHGKENGHCNKTEPRPQPITITINNPPAQTQPQTPPPPPHVQHW